MSKITHAITDALRMKYDFVFILYLVINTGNENKKTDCAIWIDGNDLFLNDGDN